MKEYAPSKGKLITIKSPTFSFSDVGYIRKSDTGIEVELFSVGQLVERFIIENDICSRQGCLSKEAFNQHYLHVDYPSDFMNHLFRGEPVFNGAGLHKSPEGFKQLIDTSEYNIIYKVTQKSVYFKDKKNSILIKIREIE
jgi:hypothetical protein